MSRQPRPDKKSEKTILDMLKEILSGKKPDPSEPKYLPKNRSLYKILVCLGVLAFLFAGVAFAITYLNLGGNTEQTVEFPELQPSTYQDSSSTSEPESTPTATPTQETTSALSLSNLFNDYHPSETISISGSLSMENLLGDTKDIWKEMQNMTMGVSMQNSGNTNSILSDSLLVGLTSNTSWSLNTSPFDVDTFRDSYLTLYRKDTDTGAMIQEFKTEITNESMAYMQNLTCPEGEYLVLVSNDPECVISAESTIYTSHLSQPPSGNLFVASPNQNTKQSSNVWNTVAEKNLETSPWKTHEIHIQVTPATVDLITGSEEQNTITISYPWRISWEITGGSSETDPYSNAEFILCNPDGSVVDSFGWKGFYPSKTAQITRSYQPGNYVLAVYLRSCGAKLTFQQDAGPVYFENATPISDEMMK